MLIPSSAVESSEGVAGRGGRWARVGMVPGEGMCLKQDLGAGAQKLRSYPPSYLRSFISLVGEYNEDTIPTVSPGTDPLFLKVQQLYNLRGPL